MKPVKKKLTVYSRNTFCQKIPPQEFESALNNANSYFEESYSPNYEHFHKFIDLMQNTNPLFNKPLTPHPWE